MTVSNPDEKWRTFRDLQPFYLPFRISRATQRLFPTTSLFQFQDWSNWWCGSSLKSCYFCFQFALNFIDFWSFFFTYIPSDDIHHYILSDCDLYFKLPNIRGKQHQRRMIVPKFTDLMPFQQENMKKKKRGAGAVTPLLPWQQPRQGPWPVKAMGSTTLMVGIQYQYVHAQDHSPRAAAMAHAASK